MTAQASPTRNAAVSAAPTAAAVVGLFGQQWPSICGGGHMRERCRGTVADETAVGARGGAPAGVRLRQRSVRSHVRSQFRFSEPPA
jgi:hypothetical protein